VVTELGNIKDAILDYIGIEIVEEEPEKTESEKSSGSYSAMMKRVSIGVTCSGIIFLLAGIIGLAVMSNCDAWDNLRHYTEFFVGMAIICLGFVSRMIFKVYEKLEHLEGKLLMKAKTENPSCQEAE